MEANVSDFKNNIANLKKNKKPALIQRPYTAQALKLGYHKYPNNPQGLINKITYEEDEATIIDYNNNNTNLPPALRGVRPTIGTQNKIISKEGLLDNVKTNEFNEEIGLGSKELNTDLFMMQEIQKLIPKNTPLDKEKLYEETLFLKNLTNKLKDENTKLKTRNLTLEKENTRLSKAIDKGIPSHPTQIHSYAIPENSLMINLRRQNKEIREELKLKIEEIEALKRNTKVTKCQELEAELKTYLEENIRLKSLVEHQLKKNSQLRPEDYHALEEKYYSQCNLVDNLQKEVIEYKQTIKSLEEENNSLKTSKEKEEKAAKKLQTEVNRLKSQIREKDQEIQKFISTSKSDAELANNKKNTTNFRLKNNTTQNTEGAMKKLLEQKDKRIEELEQMLKAKQKEDSQLNNDKSKSTESLEDIKQKYAKLEQAYKELENKLNDISFDKQRLEIEKKYIYSPTQPINHNGEGLLERANRVDNMNMNDTSKIIKEKVVYDDVKDIGYELTLILRLKQIPYDELEEKLFDKKNSRTPISLEDLKIILLSDPFDLNDINNAYLAARFIFENEDEEHDPSQNNNNALSKIKELGALKANFKKLIGDYSLVTEDVERFLFDGVAQAVSKHEEKIMTYFDSLPTAKNESITMNELVKGLKALNIDLEEDEIDYLILRLYDISHTLDELDYYKMFDIFQTEDKIRLKQIFNLYNTHHGHNNPNYLHQIKETDSEDRDRIKIGNNITPTGDPSQDNKHQQDENYDNDKEEEEERQNHDQEYNQSQDQQQKPQKEKQEEGEEEDLDELEYNQDENMQE